MMNRQGLFVNISAWRIPRPTEGWRKTRSGDEVADTQEASKLDSSRSSACMSHNNRMSKHDKRLLIVSVTII